MFFSLRTACLLFALFVCSVSASAQILNVEKARVDKDSSHYFTGKVGLNLNLFNRATSQEGKTDHFLGLNGNGNIGYVSERNTYLLLASYNYVRLKGETQIETGSVHARVTFNRQDRLSYEAFSQAQYDYNRGLELRLLAGAGIRYAVVRKENIRFHVGTGLMYEHERWRHLEENRYIKKDIPKLSTYASVRLPLTPYLELSTIHYYQVGYDQPARMDRHRFSGDISIITKINSRFHLTTNFSHTYEGRPIVPIPNYLYSLTNGVQYSF
ncbi:DUF481 domain-containing protein [Rufibacter glacialis]|uniref:DUF481 domain-containing protein n=1 Tax=Rufibacter glacialis TaxID=1259555 RepID=A0A5M8QS72_9BACT|nr:DUF481 domain-containing protein [Rufibacter glacialis]KAA6438081.1 DUF481 domain-containing protein [Rufibacter glacialis]GGK88389.1 hypothetical protein GCM10011405_40180 [Rufibacter glacialis]